MQLVGPRLVGKRSGSHHGPPSSPATHCMGWLAFVWRFTYYTITWPWTIIDHKTTTTRDPAARRLRQRRQ
jgi:hypothetical protein